MAKPKRKNIFYKEGEERKSNKNQFVSSEITDPQTGETQSAQTEQLPATTEEKSSEEIKDEYRYDWSLTQKDMKLDLDGLKSMIAKIGKQIKAFEDSGKAKDEGYYKLCDRFAHYTSLHYDKCVKLVGKYYTPEIKKHDKPREVIIRISSKDD